MDIIIGRASIEAAMKNPARKSWCLITADESINATTKFCGGFVNPEKKGGSLPTPEAIIGLVTGGAREQLTLSANQFLGLSQQIYKHFAWEYKRVPSKMILISPELPFHGANWVTDLIGQNNGARFLFLDGISDVNNAGAILRTAAFFDLSGVIISIDKTFGRSPAFFGNARGGAEIVPIATCSQPMKWFKRWREAGLTAVALSEHAEISVPLPAMLPGTGSRCLLLGNEEHGLSHALLRNIEYQRALPARGALKSLNVSVAAALAIQMYLT